jgi:hypothetical protein
VGAKKKRRDLDGVVTAQRLITVAIVDNDSDG